MLVLEVGQGHPIQAGTDLKVTPRLKPDGSVEVTLTLPANTNIQVGDVGVRACAPRSGKGGAVEVAFDAPRSVRISRLNRDGSTRG